MADQMNLKPVAVACDHAGYGLKLLILEHLRSRGVPYRDFGCDSAKSCDYPVFACRAGRAVASGECRLGILICGTGAGISIAANKVKGVRCAACSEPYSAQMAREHNDANMIAFGARVVGPDLAFMITDTFLKTKFMSDHPNHVRRVGLIKRMDAGDDIGNLTGGRA